MSTSGCRYRTMQLLSTTLLIVALVIAISPGDGATAVEADNKVDQVAEESVTKTRAVTIVDGPKYVNETLKQPPLNVTKQTHQPEQRPPSKPPLKPIPDKQGKQIKYVEITRPYYGPVQNLQSRPYHNGKQNYVGPNHPNKIYKYPQVIPLKHRGPYYSPKPPRQQLVFAASTGKPYVITAKSPKFSIPVQTVNGIRTDFVRPPKSKNSTTTTTTTTTTTKKPLRNKRIWPKHILDKLNSTASNDTNSTVTTNSTTSAQNVTKTGDDLDPSASASIIRVRYVNRTATATTSTTEAPRGYRRVTRVPKHKSTTPSPPPPLNLTFEPNDWVPIVPSHYNNVKRLAPKTNRIDLYQTPISRRSDKIPTSDRRSDFFRENNPRHAQFFLMPAGDSENPADDRRTLYLQSYGVIPLNRSPSSAANERKKMVFFRKRRQLNPHVSGYSTKPVVRPSGGRYVVDDLDTAASRRRPRYVTKVKHHHHHHHHKYVKTVEKPVKVPVKVEVPKPYPVTVEKKVPYPVPYAQIVQVEKKVPYPVTVEKKVPYPVQVRVPHPVPVKVVEKEYVPKPYPIVHHVPIVKHVEVKVPQPVPVPYEKRVPVPYEVQVPVDRPVPVEVTVEKKVPYPVPVKVYVPQPYPVEKKVPYPVEVKVKEPYEVIKHVKVPVPQPFAVKVPVEVEKRVPYPVEVEKKVPVPFRVYVPQRVEVEKKVPVYVPKPYPVEKKVPVPVKVPYPVKVPVKVPVHVPVGVPLYVQQESGYDNADGGVVYTVSAEGPTEQPQHTVTVHGNTGFSGFSSRSDGSTTPSSTTVST